MTKDAPYWDWRTQGSCSQLSISEVEKLFFPTNGRTIKRAKEFCETKCKVFEDCLKYATNPNAVMEKGIIAGLSEKDRRAIHQVNAGPGKTNSGSFKKKVVRRSNFVMT